MIQIGIVRKDVQGEIYLFPMAMCEGDPFQYLVDRKVPGPVPQVELFSPDIDGVGSIENSKAQFFQIPSRD